MQSKRIRDSHHLAKIRQCPCVITLSREVQACHIRLGTDGGTGLKPSDNYVIPMDWRLHADSHRIGERSFFNQYGGHEKFVKLANGLYGLSLEEMQKEIIRFHALLS